MLNILSIDIEDWYMSYDSSQISAEKWPLIESRVEKSTRIILSLLAKHNQKATFFVLGWIAERHPKLIREISDAGHEIGYHSYLHALPVNQGPVVFEADLLQGLNLLESITGKRPVQYRAPMFSMCNESSWAILLLIKHGIVSSSSYKAFENINGHPVPNQPFYFKHEGKSLLEFPLNRLNLPLLNWVYTGSGYFRLLPGWLLKRLFRHHPYNMVYFHPRDFDTRVPASIHLLAYRNLMNRTGNATTAKKLENLLNTHTFLTIGEAAFRSKKEWMPVVKF